MRKYFRSTGLMLLAVSFIIAFSSCEKEDTPTENLPTASFTYEPTNIIQFDTVQFTNTSTDASSYLWDFGGSLTLTEENPSIIFETSGTVTVKLTATNGDGSNTTEKIITIAEAVIPVVNNYTLDGVEYLITTDFFWYQSSMGGSPYIRLITDMPGNDTIQDLLKLYPNQGLDELEQTYIWDEESDPGTYDLGYTSDYDGSLSYDWTSIGKEGSSDLVIELVEEGIYSISGELVLSVGSYDWSTGEFTETSVKTLVLEYTGAITPLP